MRFSYKFSNLLGTVYFKGNLIFVDRNTLISPVGNRISLYYLKDNKSETLPIESRYNFTHLALSPDKLLLIAVNEAGEALLCSLISKTVIQRFHFHHPIQDIKFSPNGKYVAVAKGNNLFLYQTPTSTIDYNPFHLAKVFHFSYDNTLCIDWTSDSRVLAVGGADMTTKICAVDRFQNLSIYTLGSHSDSVVGCFFEEQSLDLYTVSKNGQLCIWDCSVELEGLIPHVAEEEEEELQNMDENGEEEKAEKVGGNTEEEGKEKFFYKRRKRHYLLDALNKEGYVALTSSAYHRKTHLLTVGFSNGSFLLYEMPECNLIHSLSISSQVISSITFNTNGDWIALGCFGVGQLVVWEWQSESFVLKQQGHFNNLKCLTYSPEGLYILTGGEDAKVKLWSTFSGFCVVTKDEHSGAITDVAFTPNGKVFLSSSLDGTVRAYDLVRYRNFRTFTSPRPTQFSSLTVDPSGDVVCAGSTETFEVFVWSMLTGHLVQILSGHEAPVSSISFCPSEAILVSASWDKTVRIWDTFVDKGCRETVTLSSDGLCTVFRPDGLEFAVSTLDGQICFFNVRTAQQTGMIEGRNDLYVGRRETDVITAKQLLKSQAFLTLCYTVNGECILAAGKSKFICVYHVAECILLKKFEVTCNLSFDAVQDFINRRRLTEFGNKALIEERGDEASQVITLPGTKMLDLSSRNYRPEITVFAVQFSPTGADWAAATTEGLLVYSLNSNAFDPFDLDIGTSPENVHQCLRKNDYSQALTMSFRLNDEKLKTEVMESIPTDNIPTISAYISDAYLEKILKFLGSQLQKSPHIEFILAWIQSLLMNQGLKLKSRSTAVMDTILTLVKNVAQHLEPLRKICDQNRFSIEFLLSLKPEQKALEIEDKVAMINQEDMIDESSDIDDM